MKESEEEMNCLSAGTGVSPALAVGEHSPIPFSETQGVGFELQAGCGLATIAVAIVTGVGSSCGPVCFAIARRPGKK